MSGTKGRSQPFIYGRPLRPREFLNYEAELSTIFNRLRNGESTAVIGEPHIGKTSLLLKVADEETQLEYLGDDAKRVVNSLLDLHPIDSDYTPGTFWEDALAPLYEYPNEGTINRLDTAAQAGYARRPLIRLFNHLETQQRRLLLMLDEFELLLAHPNFRDPAFFALLRSLATRTGGLVLIPASRLSVSQMNRMGRGLLEIGSPFFNNVIPVRLRPFEEEAVEELLARAGNALSPIDRRFIRRVAGHHPFLLQALAAALIETDGRNRQVRAAEQFHARIVFHFDDLWHTLNPRTRCTVIVLSLVELGKRTLGQAFACGEIENVTALGPELGSLARLGLAERVEEGQPHSVEHSLFWHGERWMIGSQALAWWVRDMVMRRSLQSIIGTEWLSQEDAPAIHAGYVAPGDTDQYDLAAIRDLIRDAFTDKELWRFCQERPSFRPILTRFSSPLILEDQMDVLIEYCRGRLLLCELLEEIEELYPRQYERHRARLYAGDRPPRGGSEPAKVFESLSREPPLLSQAQWECLIGMVREAHELVAPGVGALARGLYEELAEQ